MSSRARGRPVPLFVLVVAVIALVGSALWVTTGDVGGRGVSPWAPDQSARGPMPGPVADVGSSDGEFEYLAGMVVHHQEAVDAARQLERSGRPEMRALGASIVATQTAEITTMTGWLAAWYPGRSPAVEYQPMMRDLSMLSGDALDEAFLRDMIPHHMLAVMMSQRLLIAGSIEHSEVSSFARTVRDAQHTEIFQMRRYLADWFGGGAVGFPMRCGPWTGPGSCSSPAVGGDRGDPAG